MCNTMTAPLTPYSSELGNQDPLAAMRSSIEHVQDVTRDWPANRFERSYAPGKWNARQLLTHLAQTEVALGTRARMAIVTAGYVAQDMDQDAWISLDARLSGRAAVDAFVAIARMNVGFFEGLSSAERARTLEHPQYGTLTVDWVLHQMAGHHIHHIAQLRRIP